MPSILFIHENFPAQFGGIAGYLARHGWRVVFATAAEQVPPDGSDHTLIPGVHVVGYRRAREVSENIHRYLRSSEKAVLNAQAFSRIGAALNKGGFAPDIVVAHSGWGSGSLARVVWPKAKFVQYLEWWYNIAAPDAEPSAKYKNPENYAAETLCKNLPFLLDAQVAEAIVVPTRFQASQLPALLRPLVKVQHDGVDETQFCPADDHSERFSLPNLPADAPLVTYATRGMEPMRGFPQFMQAWAQLQHKWPDAHCVIAGTERVCYGAQLPEGDSFKKRMLAQYDYDLSRLHFTGHLPKKQYRNLLQRSNAHVYLTRPFVLSWSLIEAMLCGAPIVAADTAPVREVAPADSVQFVDMDSPPQIADAISLLLSDPSTVRSQSQAACAHAKTHYAASRIWPETEEFYRSLIG